MSEKVLGRIQVMRHGSWWEGAIFHEIDRSIINLGKSRKRLRLEAIILN